MAHSLDDMSQAKIEEELKYYHATQGRSLNDDDAARKLKVQTHVNVCMSVHACMHVCGRSLNDDDAARKLKVRHM